MGFTLQSGDTVKDRIVEMTPQAVLTGRVTDEFGDPVEGAFVSATPVTGDASRSLVLSRMNGSTNDRGQFRVTGAPGKFRISVSTSHRPGVHEIRTDGSEIPVYAETWYPSTDSRARGAVVEAIGGREIAGIDMRLIRKRSLTLGGVVTGVPEGSGRAQVFVHTKTFGLPFTMTDDQGRFSVAGLAAENYTVWAHSQSGNLQFNSAPVVVPLESANETGLRLRVAPPEELSGTLEFERNATGPAPAPNQRAVVHIDAITPSFWTETQGGNVDRERKFSITSVFPAKYRLRVESLPENAFIKSVSVDGKTLADTVVDLSGGVNGVKVKVTIGLDGASIEGKLSSEDGKPVCCAMVVVADGIEHVNDHMISLPGGERYRFIGLRPGKYRLIVSGPSRDYGTQTAEELFDQSPEIELHEGDHLKRDVTFKPSGAR
ncbi:MAG TPA: carboxypeptidase-like regulatory domain-containing protein [Bryobacteraceae bacterium]